MPRRVVTRLEMLSMPMTGMAVTQDWLNRMIQQNPYGYHMVKTDNPFKPSMLYDKIKSILQNGLIPWDEGHGTMYPNQVGSPRPGHVYIGLDPEMRLGGGSSSHLKIDLRQLDPAKINLDEDSLMGTPVKGMDTIPSYMYAPNQGNSHRVDYFRKLEPGQQSFGEFANLQSDLIDKPENVEKRVAYNKTLAYRGVVPPSAISLNEDFQGYGQLRGYIYS